MFDIKNVSYLVYIIGIERIDRHHDHGRTRQSWRHQFFSPVLRETGGSNCQRSQDVRPPFSFAFDPWHRACRNSHPAEARLSLRVRHVWCGFIGRMRVLLARTRNCNTQCRFAIIRSRSINVSCRNGMTNISVVKPFCTA